MKKSTKQAIRKRIASIMLSAVLAVMGAGLLPQFALPVQAAAPTQYDISSDSVDLNISSDSTIEITGSTDMHYVTIDVAAGKNVTVNLNNLTIDCFPGCAFKITGDGNAVINLIGTNTLSSGTLYAGLQKENAGTLKITGTGALEAIGGPGGAGIGGGYDGNGSNITISGGTVTTSGGVDGAGIGGGSQGNGSDITISGGTVRATGGPGGAGIGGGCDGNGSDITISGGTVTASGGVEGSGIGGGSSGNGSNITISGGTVTANGGDWAAGIGGGVLRNGANISISAGTVYAIGGGAGSGIGGGVANGPAGTASEIAISGSANVYVAGGADRVHGSEHYGSGSAIGTGGHSDDDPGDEIIPDTSGLYTNGRINYYPAGTRVSNITNGTVQPSSTIIGSVPAPQDGPMPINYMQEVEDKLSEAIALGGAQTVHIEGYSTLSYHVLEMLQQHPDITLVSEFTYDGMDYKLTIPGSAVKLDPAYNWFGPKYLFPMFYMYGSDAAPSLQAYLDKYAVQAS